MKKKKELSREQLQAEALLLYVAGLSVREIARRLASSPATISRILTRRKNKSEQTVSPSAVSPSAELREDRGSAVGEGVQDIGGGGRGPEGLNDGEIRETVSPSARRDRGSAVGEGVQEIGKVPQGETENENLKTENISDFTSPISPFTSQKPFTSDAPPMRDKITDKINTAVIDIIAQIQRVTDGETDIAKLATAADKLSTIAERITNLSHLADNNNQNIFATDFLNRHQQQKKNN